MSESQQDVRLAPGDLPGALLACTRSAVAQGVLHSIETQPSRIEDGGVRFLVRAVPSLERKEQDRRRDARVSTPGRAGNPFLPPEPELTVGAIGSTHLAVLNKFNVIEQHLLIVTRRFESQEALMTPADFEALWFCLREIDGLGFYNGGPDAGASQPHKHLQMVPLPLAADGPPVPMESRFPRADAPSVVQRLTGLPFPHVFCALRESQWENPAEAAALTHTHYLAMLEACAIPALERGGQAFQSAPYNLLLRRGWMLLVPRAREHFEGISVNALGYAGSLFVRNASELASIRRAGPMRILAAVAGAGGQGRADV
jgi:ATP adenylyltransferase